jgi:hypothetical protein
VQCLTLHGQEIVTAGSLLLSLVLVNINALLLELNASWMLQKYRIYMRPA